MSLYLATRGSLSTTMLIAAALATALPVARAEDLPSEQQSLQASPRVSPESDKSTIEHEIVACLESGPDLALAWQTKAITSDMFRALHIKIRWHNFSHCPDAVPDRGEEDTRAHPPVPIRIRVSEKTPEQKLPGALAYALPYEGTDIMIFLDRIQSMVTPKQVPSLMAHVLAHEIAHILQGSARHSSKGIMKARWEASDYAAMAWRPLTFTEWDAILIEQGVVAREGGAALPGL